MEYICDRDRDYILNKFHDTSKPFDTFQRFIVREGIFDETTGISPAEIRNLIVEQDEKSTECHAIRKAKAMDLLLRNTRIACDPRDRFPAIQAIDRSLNQTIVQKWKNEVFGEIIPETERERSFLEQSGAVAMWPDYDHSVPVWDTLFAVGLTGVKQNVLAAEETYFRTHEENAEKRDYFAAMAMTYDSLIRFVGRLADLAEKTAGSERMAKALRALEAGAPKTFYEALLLDYIYFIVSEHISGLQVRSLGNFDRLFYPFVKNDRQNGVSETEIRTDIAYFYLQFTAIGNYWDQPVYLGGEKADGTTEVNELSYIALDVYDKMGIFNPKWQIKICDSTPKAFFDKTLDMVRRGHNSMVFVGDRTIRRALGRLGVSDDAARRADVKGCYEYTAPGGYDMSMNYTNLVKPLEYALHGGRDAATGVQVGPVAPEEYATFADLFAEYKRQLGVLLGKIMKTVNTYEQYLYLINPQPMLSATYPRALETGCDALGGGSDPAFSEVLLGFTATVADSLASIEKYVYEKKELTLAELRTMLDANYEGYEIWRRRFLADREKYGNNCERPDRIAKEILTFVADNVLGKPNAPVRGGKWTVGTHVARMSYIQGSTTMATPDGRRRGEELSKNLSASMGQNREGATAAILSATKMDHSYLKGDACVDVGLLPSAVKGEDGLDAMRTLLLTFFARGGHAVQFNVFDAETLREAQKHPENYRDLQIRVCGWNVLFNDIAKEEQDGFIRQAESLI